MAIDDSYTKALLHFDGADLSTTITDESGKTWSRFNNAKLTTSYVVFGTAGLRLPTFPGDDYIDTADHDDWHFGSGDFTIDFWTYRFVDGTDPFWICGQLGSVRLTASGSFAIQKMPDNTVRCAFYISGGTGWRTITSTSTIGGGAWKHIAMVKYGDTITLYINGGSEGSYTESGMTLPNDTNRLFIGKGDSYVPGVSSNYYPGAIDEFRISKGIARWTTTFTPSRYSYLPKSAVASTYAGNIHGNGDLV